MELLTYASLGVSTGGAYALVALGLVAAYRGTGVINFAQGALGMFGAYAFWKLHTDVGVPVILAIPFGILVSGLIGIAFYAVVGKRLAQAPPMTKILITLGLLLILEAIVRIVWTNHQVTVDPFLVSGGFELLGVRVQNISILLGAAALVATAALHMLFTRTRFGHVTIAIQDTDLGAQSIGINPRLWGSLAWGLAGVLAASGSILVLPITQLSPTASTTLLVPALGAALAAKFRSLWLAFTVAIVAGVLEGFFTGLIDAQVARAIPQIIALAVLVVFARTDMRRGTREIQTVFHVGDGRIRVLPSVIAVLAVTALIFGGTGSTVDALSLTAIFGLVALGIVVSTGYTGQVNALPLTLGGVSMIVFGASSHAGLSLYVAAAVAIAVTLAAAFVSSAVFVRARIYEVTIGSLALASIVQTLVFSVDRFFNGTNGWAIGHTLFFGIDVSNITNPRGFALLSWAVLLAALVAVANLRRSATGRSVLSVRQDERIPAALGISAVRAKFTGILISATLWALAGVLLAVQRGFISKGQISLEGFSYSDSLALIAFTILAGAGHLAGAVLAGLFAPGGLLASALSFTPDVNDWLSLFFAANMVLVLTTEPDGVVGQYLRLRTAISRKVSGKRASRESEYRSAVEESVMKERGQSNVSP